MSTHTQNPPPHHSGQQKSSLRIVYNNDPHKKFLALPGLVTGFRLFSREAEMAGADVLRLNGGDNHVAEGGKAWELNVLLMNLIRYHGMAMGNHELDQGSASLSEGLNKANFITFVSNLKLTKENPLNRHMASGRIQTGSQIVEGKHGKYALLGVTTPEMDSVGSRTLAKQGVDVHSFDKTCAMVQEEVRKLEQQGINKIILLSHMGYTLDKKLAKQVSGIDVIVGGHSHDNLRGIVPEYSTQHINPNHMINLVSSPAGEPVLLLQAGKDGRWFGVADVQFNDKGHVLPHSNQFYNPFKLPADPQATAIKDAYLGPPIPVAQVMTQYRNKNIPFQEDPVAEFVADAARRLSGAEISFIRSPEIRNNIQPGVITDQELDALMPFTDPLVRFSATGNEILGALKRSAQGLMIRDGHPGMLHPSGLAVTMNQSTGDVASVHVLNRVNQWEPLNLNRTYSVAMGEFTVKNPKEFPELAHPDRIQWNSQMPMKSVFHWGMVQAGAPWRPMNFQKDGRLKII